MFVQLALAAALAAPAQAAPQTVLVVTDTAGYRHASIPAARAALERLEGPGLDVRDVDAADLTGPRLRGADAVVFALTNGDIPGDRRALRRFVRRGGGLAGFHSATGTYRSWPGWETLLGGRFDHHEEPGATETATVVDPGHPAVRGVPATFRLREEWYVHEPGVARRAQVLLRWGVARRPLVWVRSPGRGRVFYDALGHHPATWADPRHEALVRSGLRWVLRR